MDEAKNRLVRAWLAKAESDLLTASLLIEDKQILLDAAVFHCHQAAEKAFKAWMTHAELPFRKTHDLELLLRECLPRDPSLAQFAEQARYLTPLAVQFRYPGDIEQPASQEARKALDHARQLYEHFLHELS